MCNLFIAPGTSSLYQFFFSSISPKGLVHIFSFQKVLEYLIFNFFVAFSQLGLVFSFIINTAADFFSTDSWHQRQGLSSSCVSAHFFVTSARADSLTVGGAESSLKFRGLLQFVS
jgi:hypothetical protein